MPTLVSRRPGGLRIVPMDGLGCLLITAVTVARHPAFALAWRYPTALPFIANPHAGTQQTDPRVPPNPWAGAPLWQDVRSFQTEVIAAAPIEFAPDTSSVQRVADVALDAGTREGDCQRTVEAMTLFRNLDRLREESLDAATQACVGIVQAYWVIAEWMSAPAEQHPPSLRAGDAFLVLR
jgi:hypothetical protein